MRNKDLSLKTLFSRIPWNKLYKVIVVFKNVNPVMNII